jgi:hypothetical protein
MFDLFAIALFQIASLIGYNPSAQATGTEPTPPKTENADGTVGSGGWGNDVAPNCDGTVGSGGWGND